MLSSLQPHRPTLHKPQPPQHHTQLRHSHQTPALQQLQQQQPTRPKSQIEAMPPAFQPLTQAHFSPPPRLPQWDPATCHPVFFTQTLRKPPFPFADAGGGMASPVAFGYVAEAYGINKGSGGAAKL